MNKKYKYIGIGAGIPGLPHEITDTGAAQRGVEELLAQAVKAGQYRVVSKPPAKVPAEKSRSSRSAYKSKKE